MFVTQMVCSCTPGLAILGNKYFDIHFQITAIFLPEACEILIRIVLGEYIDMYSSKENSILALVSVIF